MKIQIKKVSPRLPEVHEVDFGSTEPIDDVSRIKRYAPRIFGSGQLAAGLCEDMRGIRIVQQPNVDYQPDPKILGAQHFIAETSSIGTLEPKSTSCTSGSLGENFLLSFPQNGYFWFYMPVRSHIDKICAT